MDIVEAIAKVLVVGLIFGAGLPALFAVGLRVHEQGSDEVIDGSLVKGNPAMRVLSYAIFVVVLQGVLVACLGWLTLLHPHEMFRIPSVPVALALASLAIGLRRASGETEATPSEPGYVPRFSLRR